MNDNVNEPQKDRSAHAAGLAPGTLCLMTRDIVIGGEAAFLKGETVVIEAVTPDPDKPEFRYRVTSAQLNLRKFLLRDQDLEIGPAPRPDRERPAPRKLIKIPAVVKRHKGLAAAIAGATIAVIAAVVVLTTYSFKWSLQFANNNIGDGLLKVSAGKDGTAYAIGRVESGSALFARGPNGWAPVAKGQSSFTDLSVTDAAHAWIVSSGGRIYFYDGTSFIVQFDTRNAPRSGGAYDSLNEVFALDSSHVWAVGWFSYETADSQGRLVGMGTSGVIYFFNGTAWSASTVVGGHRVVAVTAADPSHVWAATRSGDIYFFNGQVWALQYSSGVHVTAMAAADASHAWAFSSRQDSKGKIFSFNGTSWNLQDAMDEVDFADACAVDSEHVWAVGIDQQQATKQMMAKNPVDYMDVLTRAIWTFDGGSWKRVKGPPGSDMCTAVSAVGASNVWLVSRSMLFHGCYSF